MVAQWDPAMEDPTSPIPQRAASVFSFAALLVRFSARDEVETRQEMDLSFEAYAALENSLKNEMEFELESEKEPVEIEK
jgi:hypothetical protein